MVVPRPARRSRVEILYSLDPKANSAVAGPSSASFTSQPLLCMVPLRNAITSAVTSQLNMEFFVLSVLDESVGVATNAPPGVHGVEPLQVFQVAPLRALPLPSTQVRVMAWALYTRVAGEVPMTVSSRFALTIAAQAGI